MISPTQSAVPVSWQLLDMRARLRLIDTQLVVLLARRLEVQREIRAYKLAESLPLHDPVREAAVLAHGRELARSLSIPEGIVEVLYERLFEAARGTVNETAP